MPPTDKRVDGTFLIMHRNYIMIEEWKAIPGFEGLYEVSNLGRIKSIRREILRTTPRDVTKFCYASYGGKVLKPSVAKSRYNKLNPYPIFCFVTLSKQNIQYNKRVHRLVLESFVGSCPAGMEGCHNDGDPTNNKLSNLRWDTASANQRDRKLHGTAGGFKKGQNSMSGTITRGSANKLSKLKEKDVLEIRGVIPYLGMYRDLSEKYGVSISTIEAVLSRRNWTHI